MSCSVLPASRRSRRLPAGLLAIAVVTTMALLAPAGGRANVAEWTPNSTDLAQAARICPSPGTARYYHTRCWTVAHDQSDPLYRADAPYPWGQCTYWAIEMRPDLWNDQSMSDPHRDNWTAYTWPAHAELEDLIVDHVPAAGAIVVWPRTRASSTGHVAYVQNVIRAPAGGALVTVQEMNDTTFDHPSRGEGDAMTLTMSRDDLAGVQFIHGRRGG